MEKIEVVYRKIGPFYYHKYILYTDANGNQFATSGWAGGDGQGGYGNIDTTNDVYDSNYPDHPDNPNALGQKQVHETIKTGDDLSGDWTKISDAMRDIDSEGYPYDPTEQNSNTTADEALERAGLPQPQNDDLGENWSPASGNGLPPKPSTWDKIKDFFEDLGDSVSNASKRARDAISDLFDGSSSWRRNTDPLVIDLDGDGIETVGTAAGIVFDHDADGVATGTGWVSGDDGILVIDKNGNGVIDDGTELFGDGNPDSIRGESDPADISAGIIALRKYDSNHDGVFDAQDASFAAVKIWRDLNQDGISQSSERFSLHDAGIQSISLTPSSTSNTDVAYGNIADSSGSFTRTDGSTGTFYDLLLANDPFNRTFKDPIALSSKAKGIASAQGSGLVRDLREAATLDDTLADAVAALASGMSRDEMMSRMDLILLKWANTSTMKDTYAVLSESGGLNGQFRVQSSGDTSTDLSGIISILERFNGKYFFGRSDDGKLTVGNVSYSATQTVVEGAAVRSFNISLEAGSASLLKQSYESLKSAIYADLVLQTRLKGYLDNLNVKQEDGRILVDVSSTLAMIQSRYAQAPEAALEDVADLVRYAGGILGESRLELLAMSEAWATTLAGTEAGLATLAAAGFAVVNGTATLAAHDGVVLAGQGNDNLYGQEGADILAGGAGDDYIASRAGQDVIQAGLGNDTVYAGDGNDLVAGGDGNDALYGESGNDTLLSGAGDDRLIGGSGDDTLRAGEGSDILQGSEGNDLLQGGAGNDTLNGGTGNNAYLFGRGDGQDLVRATHDVGANKRNVLVLGEGIATADVALRRVYDSDLGGDGALQILIQGSNGQTDAITFNGFLYGDDPLNAYNGLQYIQFADGTQWSLDDITTRLFAVVDGSIRGTLGDDSLNGNVSDNTLYGLAGNDTVHGGEGRDQLYGGAGADAMSGDGGNDMLDGGAGDDTLEGGAGNDSYNGGTGNNTYVFGVGDGQDTISGVYDDTAQKSSTLRFKAGIAPSDVSVHQVASGWGARDLVFVIGTSGDSMTVKGFFDLDDPNGAGNPLQRVVFNDGTIWSISDLLSRVYQGSAGNDEVTGTVAADAISGGDGADQLHGRSGDDVLDGGSANDILYGEDGNDSLFGGSGSDTLYGDVGDDVIEGGAGDDQLNGGSGQDTYVFGRGDGIDTIASNTGSATDELNSLSFKSGVLPTDIVLRQMQDGAGNSHLEVSIVGSADRVVIRNFVVNDTIGHAANPIQRFVFSDGTVWELSQIQSRLFGGTAGNDSIRGTTNADAMNGAAGDDTLSGGFGDDAISGGVGNDYLDGQQDNDLLLGGAGNDHLKGCDGDDVLDGGSGDDELAGNGGSNVFRFGLGDGIDTIQDNSDAGIGSHNVLELKQGVVAGDLLVKQVSRHGAAGPLLDLRIQIAGTNDAVIVHNFFLDHDTANPLNPLQQLRFADGTVWEIGDVLARLYAGTASDDVLEGTVNSDLIRGSAGNDVIRAMQGTDTLEGGDGEDALDGGQGADVMRGGAGDDLYRVDDIGDEVSELAGEGSDAIESLVSYTLPQHVEVLRLIGNGEVDGTGGEAGDRILGNESTNMLTGNGGNDFLDGAGGVDDLRGGQGDDHYLVDRAEDQVTELAGEGHDHVLASSSYTLSANIEELQLSESASNASATGNAGSNKITGNSYDNLIDGGAGADELLGGMGDDTYTVDDLGDQVVERVGEGRDTVAASVNYVLAATLEDLVLTGVADIDGTGNDGDNVLVGNDGNNRLDGGLGGDDMHGGAGNDYFVNDSSGDWIYEDEANGVDTVERRYETNLVLSDNVENLILANGIKTGNGNDLDNVITGNTGANTLGGWDGNDTLHGLDGDDALFGGAGTDQVFGGTGNDYLDGGEGIDQLDGGVGDDVYITDDGADVVVEAAGAGTDKVQTTASYTLSANIEQLFLQGGGAINGTGNALDNFIRGNAAANVIHGQGGSDTIYGEGGNDTIVGGAGDDKYVFNASSGSDVVDNTGGGFDGVFFTDGIGRDRLSFSRDGNDLLITVDNAAVPAVRVTNHFLGGDAAIDYVQPNDGGSYLTTAQINQIVAAGGTGYDQVIEGTAAGEQLAGASGKDLLKGLGGNDQLFGMAGNDTLQGGDGDDLLTGGNGSAAGSGDDRLEGGVGNDTLRAQDGANTLIGGAGNDGYVYGGGQDVIDNTGGGTDTLFFENGITAAQLAFSRTGDDLLVTVDGNANSTVRVTGHFLGGDQAIDYVQPASGSALDTAAINALVAGPNPGGGDGDYPSVVTGTAAGEELYGDVGRDLIRALGGNDTVYAFEGDDKIEGGDGDDQLYGGNGSFSASGDDILIGGAGADTLFGEDGSDQLFGGAGNDTYYFDADSGSDVIEVGGGSDWIYMAGIARGRLSFHRDVDDLIIRVDGDANLQLRVTKHFQGGQYALASVQPGDGGYSIPASQFASLLTPMSAARSSLLMSTQEEGKVESGTLGDRWAAETVVTPAQWLSDEDAATALAWRPSTDRRWDASEAVVSSISELWGEGSRLPATQFELAEPLPELRVAVRAEQRRELGSLVDAMGGFVGDGGAASMDLSDTHEEPGASSYWTSHQRLTQSGGRIRYQEL